MKYTRENISKIAQKPVDSLAKEHPMAKWIIVNNKK